MRRVAAHCLASVSTGAVHSVCRVRSAGRIAKRTPVGRWRVWHAACPAGATRDVTTCSARARGYYAQTHASLGCAARVFQETRVMWRPPRLCALPRPAPACAVRTCSSVLAPASLDDLALSRAGVVVLDAMKQCVVALCTVLLHVAPGMWRGVLTCCVARVCVPAQTTR